MLHPPNHNCKRESERLFVGKPAQTCLDLHQALALDYRPRLIEPSILLAQMRHGRLGQGVEGARAAFAAESQNPMGARPTDDLATSAMRASMAFHPLAANSPKRVLPTTGLAGFAALSSSKSLGTEVASPPFTPSNAYNVSRRCSALKSAIADSQAEKILSRHRINP